jgi:hypothetical protein
MVQIIVKALPPSCAQARGGERILRGKETSGLKIAGNRLVLL